MDRRINWRALYLGTLAALFLIAAAPLVHADDEKADDGAAEEPAGIQWIEGWKAGREQAAKDGKLIFLYFGRNAPR